MICRGVGQIESGGAGSQSDTFLPGLQTGTWLQHGVTRVVRNSLITKAARSQGWGFCFVFVLVLALMVNFVGLKGIKRPTYYHELCVKERITEPCCPVTQGHQVTAIAREFKVAPARLRTPVFGTHSGPVRALCLGNTLRKKLVSFVMFCGEDDFLFCFILFV